jgi:hypothetical protein
VRRNPQHRSLLIVVSATSALHFNPFVVSEMFATFLDPLVNRFTTQTLPAVNRKHFFMDILGNESFCPQKAPQNAALG